MEQEREKLAELIQRIEDFPKKVDYDVMIPLTSVAFVPGKIVHTNELKKVAKVEELETSSFQSAYEISLQLKEQMRQLENRLNEEKQKTPGKSLLRASTTESKPLSEKKRVVIDESSNTTSIIQKASTLSIPSSSSSSGKGPSAAATSPSPAEPIFEIREFVDDQDQNQGHELLDVTKQLQYMESLQQSSPAPVSQSVSLSLLIHS